MALMLTLLALAGVGSALAGGAVVRFLRRADHRCVEGLVESCPQCGGATRDDDRGGHLVCACGAVSPHLFGSDLLAWRAQHHGEQLPAFPADAEPLQAVAEQEPLRRTTRARAVAEEEERRRHVLAEEEAEAERRMIRNARRRPDPITPQLLREAEQFGVRPRLRPPSETGPAEVDPPAASVNATDAVGSPVKREVDPPAPTLP